MYMYVANEMSKMIMETKDEKKRRYRLALVNFVVKNRILSEFIKVNLAN